MNTPAVPVDPTRVGLQSRIIVGALMGGVLFFGGIVLAQARAQLQAPEFLQYVGIGFGVLAILLSLIIPEALTAASLKRVRAVASEDWPAVAAPIYFTRILMRNGLLEGAAFFNLVLYLVAQKLSNVMMAAAMLVVMAIRFPSQADFESWVEQTRPDRNF